MKCTNSFKYKLLKMTQEIENLDRGLTSKILIINDTVTRIIINYNLSTKKFPGPIGFTGVLYQKFKK